MTELTTTRRPSTARSATCPAPVAATPEPIVITEQQVRFSTVAALSPAPTTHWHWAVAVRVVRGLWHSDREPVRRHYPQRFAYLESALMSRELDRL
ncbi:hypothetical protein QGN32_22665 [Mycolicibacterium sp. ND9-15]|uniref:hypothetical protein n=1 Tax=Mycolicibacterium sp. ND9-15 TaxID=3042320 RepID=UPI002DDA843A|nr:hypothetical protein [Mycolicibacterium sp. ND9-15]WSE56114.1 hypothetical protein QGN32_22665 [Mycolicibacterium sp. ND9-15]